MLPRRWINGFILGGLLAAGVALLTASRSGRETRAMIAGKGVELRDKALSAIEEKRGQFGEIANEVVGKSQAQVERLKEAGRHVAAAEKNILHQGAQDAKDALTSQ